VARPESSKGVSCAPPRPSKTQTVPPSLPQCGSGVTSLPLHPPSIFSVDFTAPLSWRADQVTAKTSDGSALSALALLGIGLSDPTGPQNHEPYARSDKPATELCLDRILVRYLSILKPHSLPLHASAGPRHQRRPYSLTVRVGLSRRSSHIANHYMIHHGSERKSRQIMPQFFWRTMASLGLLSSKDRD
jgi:hypothetical protein